MLTCRLLGAASATLPALSQAVLPTHGSAVSGFTIGYYRTATTSHQQSAATVANEKRWILSPARAAACLVLALGFAFSLTLGFAFRLQTGQGTFTAFVLANTATVSSAQHTWLTRGADAGAGERRREGTARG